MLNTKAVRSFYQYQSRLLQGGFSAMFGPMFQELVLKLSFTLANSSVEGSSTKLPDVLGVIARAKTSEDAIRVSKQVAEIGELVRNPGGARHLERGLIAYASRSVELDMALLEDIRQEACYGMDACESIALMNLTGESESRAITTLATFLMQIMERMAKRLEIFYSNLSQHTIIRPAIERNPARTRWHILRQRIRDGSFFILTQNVIMGAAPIHTYIPEKAQRTVDFDGVMYHIRETLAGSSPQLQQEREQQQQAPTLNALHTQRTLPPKNGASAHESHANGTALRAMSSFVDKNMRAIRRLSRLPPASSLVLPPSLPDSGNRNPHAAAGPASPPSSRSSSRSSSHSPSQMMIRGHVKGLPGMPEDRPPTPPPMDGAAAISSLMGRMNVRSRSRAASATSMSRASSPGAMMMMTTMPLMGGGGGVTGLGLMQQHQHQHQQQMPSASPRMVMNMRHQSASGGPPPQFMPGHQPRSRSVNTTSMMSNGGNAGGGGKELRSFMLGQRAGLTSPQLTQAQVKVAPTF
jgi:hypothetical protein